MEELSKVKNSGFIERYFYDLGSRPNSQKLLDLLASILPSQKELDDFEKNYGLKREVKESQIRIGIELIEITADKAKLDFEFIRLINFASADNYPIKDKELGKEIVQKALNKLSNELDLKLLAENVAKKEVLNDLTLADEILKNIKS